MSTIKFWFCAGSCSLAVHALLHETNLPFSAVKLSIADGETLTEEFARINPKKRVPVISLDGEVITEVTAIATAISLLSPESGLMGTTAIEKCRVIEWMSWLSGELHGQCFGGLFRPQRFINDRLQFGAIQAKARERIAECFNLIENRLTGGFAVGGKFTVVDSYLLVFYRWGAANDFKMSEAFPRYTAHAQKIMAYGPVAKAMTDEERAS